MFELLTGDSGVQQFGMMVLFAAAIIWGIKMGEKNKE